MRISKAKGICKPPRAKSVNVRETYDTFENFFEAIKIKISSGN